MSYVDEVLGKLAERDPDEPEYYQAVRECLDAARPLVDENETVYRENAILERFIEPDRVISFKVPWIDRNGNVQVNRGWRVQFNDAVGAYKGGIRFHRTVNLSVMKYLGFEMVLRNALTGLPMGGAKGGADFDPKGKTDREVMSFCQSFTNELYKYVGFNMDIPTSDIGCGSREIGYMYGQYKRLTGSFEGAFTGKGLNFGGTFVRVEATGYGLAYMAEEMCRAKGMEFAGRTVVVTGSGTVAMSAARKCSEDGAKVVSMSDSDGYIYAPDGIDLGIVKEIKEAGHGRIKEYAARVEGAEYTEGKGIWNVPCEIYLPCATQYELGLEAAETLVKNGTLMVAEGANMPATPEAAAYFQQQGIMYMPGKASNAGGISVSGLEQVQNAGHTAWTFEEVDARLRGIMHDIFVKVDAAAAKYGRKGDYNAGASICALEKVAAAMIAQGIV